MRRRAVGVLLVCGVLLSLGGCYPKRYTGNVAIDFFLYVFGAPQKAAKPVRFTAHPTIQVDGTVQGLPTGGFEMTIGTAGRYGHFTGSQKIVNQRFATVKDKGSDALKAAMTNLVEDVYGQTVTITKATAKVATHETPGGVQGVYTATLTFEGTITSGPDMGKLIKKGRITFHDKFK